MIRRTGAQEFRSADSSKIDIFLPDGPGCGSLSVLTRCEQKVDRDNLFQTAEAHSRKSKTNR
jgi:hypothetical protein